MLIRRKQIKFGCNGKQEILRRHLGCAKTEKGEDDVKPSESSEAGTETKINGCSHPTCRWSLEPSMTSFWPAGDAEEQGAASREGNQVSLSSLRPIITVVFSAHREPLGNSS